MQQDSAEADVRGHRTSARATLTALFVAALLGAAVSAATFLGDALFVQIGFTSPGAVSLAMAAVVRGLAVGTGSITVGSLMFGTLVAPAASANRIGVEGFRAYETARRWSTVWFAAALAAIPLSAATSTGMRVQDLANAANFSLAFDVSEQAQGFAAATGLVLIVTIALRRITGWTAGTGMAALSALALLAPMVTGNAAQGADHDLATSAAVVHGLAAACWIGGIWSLARYLHACRRAGREVDLIIVRRVTVMFCISTVAVVLSGLMLGGTLSAGLGLTTRYGVLVLVKIILLVALLVPAQLVVVRALHRRSGRWWTPIVVQMLLLAVTLGLSVGMAGQPPPTALTSGNPNELLIGYDLPQPVGVLSLLTTWRFDMTIGGAVLVSIGMYLWGVIRLRSRGITWPTSRVIAWLIGCVLLLLATSSGLATYAGAMFSVHMVVHMTMNMFAPILLVLGGPITLILRALRPAPRGSSGPREWVVWLMHSPVFRALANPMIAIPVYVVSLYGLYFTPILDPMLRYHWGHLLMNLHFLITGYLFYWSIIGVDPGPRRFPYIGRLASLFAVMPFHAFFGVIVMSAHMLLAPNFYGSITLPWLSDPLNDQSTGGAIAWISGEIPLMVVVFALCSQWYRSDERAARRNDRHDEEEHDAYNAMLAQLAKLRGQRDHI